MGKMDELRFEPHNGYGAVDPDGEPWPFGYISTAPTPMPVFELGVVLEYPAEDLRKLALAMAAAPEMLRVLKYLYDETGSALSTPSRNRIYAAICTAEGRADA
jgi:hypothetical protein